MVSLWPWRGEDNSPATFEKTLSTLSTKIAEATTRLDQQRSSSRRFKALWLLYSTFAYLFYTIILALVLGWESWGVKEYAAIAGGPVLIYTVRTLGARIFDYRISRLQRRLNEHNKQRDETIEKLKVATKYNSTQQLLEKYGGESPKQSPDHQAQGQAPGSGPGKKQKPMTPSQPVARTGLPPPPTANIRRPSPQVPVPAQQPFDGQQQQQQQQQQAPGTAPSPPPPGYQESPHQQFQPHTPSPPSSPLPQADEPGFAPNAFPSSGQYIEQPHWYDRLLDVLLGEDEMQPRNRMAMICASCRLVNGQAPPGIKTPEELGKWRCGSCGSWNGVESETTKMLSTLRQREPGQGSFDTGLVLPEGGSGQSQSSGEDRVVVENSDESDSKGVTEEDDEVVEDVDDQEEVEEKEPVRRSKRKGGRNSKLLPR